MVVENSSKNMILIFHFINSRNTQDESVIFKGRYIEELTRELKKCEVKADVYYIMIRHVSVTFVH